MKQFSVPVMAFRSSSTPPVSASGESKIYFDSTLGTLMVSNDGGPWVSLGEGSINTLSLGITLDGYQISSGTTSLEFSPEFSAEVFDGYVAIASAGPDPTGFVDQAEIDMSYVDLTRTFTISYSGAPGTEKIRFFVNGKPGEILTSLSTVWPNQEGLHWIYIDQNFDLTTTQALTGDLIRQNALVAVLYWSVSAQEVIFYGNECHGAMMSGATHSYLHNVRGAALKNGLALQNFSVDTAGATDASAEFGCEDGSFYDEDIFHDIVSGAPQNITNQIEMPIFYRTDGGDGYWNKKEYDGYQVVRSDGVVFTGAAGRPAWNQFSMGNWALAEVEQNKFFLIHVLATNEINTPIIGILGTEQYNNINSARQGANVELLSMSGLPFPEMVTLGSVIFQANNGFLNTAKATVRSTDTGAAYLDLRTQSTSIINGGISHSSLSGLSHSDHPAASIYTDVDAFDGYILTSVDTNVQNALSSLDEEISRFSVVHEVAYAASVAIDFAGSRLWSIGQLTGDLQLTTLNLAKGQSVLIRFSADGTNRNLTLPAWKFFGSAAPSLINANKSGQLRLRCWGTLDSDVDAEYVESV